MAKELPKITLSSGKVYYIDRRLGELRNVENPHDLIRAADFCTMLTTEEQLNIIDIVGGE